MKVYFEGGLGKSFGEVIGEVEDNGISLYVVKIRNDGVRRAPPTIITTGQKEKVSALPLLMQKTSRKSWLFTITTIFRQFWNII